MTEYRRAWHPGATWFFTVNLAERRGNRLLVERIDVLRTAFRNVRAWHPFHIEAIVILADHLHCVWTLGPGDTDCSTRWSLIKGQFSRAIEKGDAFRKAAPSGVNEAYGSAVSGNISSGIKLTSTVTWITSIGTQ
jgi:REP-associated tyrosine transposase